ncbi:adenine phosphoribosyltransferase [Atheta coriaria]|uniref:adenine phosphoribosyltransferase n=1 Tax=Dalotia coriaria TaxID=877792 RepID=UPI0031F3E382
MSTTSQKIQTIKEHIKGYPDFPTKNVLFRDIFSVLKQPSIFALLRDIMLEHTKSLDFDCVIGLDSRGFLFGPIISLEHQKPFIPIRKKGKLPGEVTSVSYKLEYGEDIFEIQADAIKSGDRILIIDDLLATGGSLSASCELVQLAGGIVVECLVVMELAELKGRDKFQSKVHSFIQY